MMNDGYYGMGAGDWIAMTIFWLGGLTLAAWAVWALWRTAVGPHAPTRPAPAGSASGTTESAADIVDRRFATGEIDEDTYRSMRAALDSARPPLERHR
ncbi:MAG: hypothetical protein ABF306_07030 [Nocardioides marinisabuli]|uniref:SHOCT domain-containing protein n=1 Tax=Nocardioides marinisabuli TaxID=419476 RepID=UPI00321A6CB8